ncbi:MAG: exodeoxyribonuclease VII small subunit [Eubacterium sp.]|jgi:exodeoxyribonuclease VII small subunit
MPEKKKEEMTFEEALGHLKEISEKIKSQDMTMDETLKFYKEGTEYYEKCKAIINEAKLKVDYYGRDEN